MRSIEELARTPIPRERILAGLGIASLISLVLTWGSVPWNWGFPIVTVSMWAIARAVGRYRQPESWLAYPWVLVIVGPQILRLFYGSATSWQASIHVCGVYGLSMVVGVWLANQLAVRELPPRQI